MSDNRAHMQKMAPLFIIEKDQFQVRKGVTAEMLTYENSISINRVIERLLDAEDMLVVRDDHLHRNADIHVVYMYLCIVEKVPSATFCNETQTIVCLLES